ncbi:MAG TPA: cytochrome b/b6 domain-containing protein [Thermoleophilia bacterium]|nr:cytochrome b/b6 domain-containing protein [Thermoleophilia bacterium]
MWLDVGFTVLYVLVVVGLAAHLAGNLVTGRLKNRFVNREWPVHDAPPVPILHKFLHFQHVFSMFALGFTGLYIRFPFFDGGRPAMRAVHYVFMIVVTINFAWRLWCAFFSRRRDYREFAITKQDVCTAPACALYYTFVKSSKPHYCKYNVMQKATYMLFIPLMLTQAFTGFALVVTPFIFGYSPRDLLLGWWLGALLGSTDLAGWYARTLHYAITWLFIILTTVHAYLSFTEDFPAVRDFFGFVTVPRGERCEVPGPRRGPARGDIDQARPSLAPAQAEPAPAAPPRTAARLTPMGAPPPGGPSAGERP